MYGLHEGNEAVGERRTDSDDHPKRLKEDMNLRLAIQRKKWTHVKINTS